MSISKVSIFPKILYHVLYRNLHNTSLHLTKLISDNFHVSGPEWFFFSYFKYWYFRSLKRFRDCDFFCQCPWTSWNNEKWYNKRALIWHFTLVFMKSYAGNWQIIAIAEIDEIKWQSNTGPSVLKSKGLYRTGGHFTGLARRSNSISFSLLCLLMIIPTSSNLTTFDMIS